MTKILTTHFSDILQCSRRKEGKSIYLKIVFDIYYISFEEIGKTSVATSNGFSSVCSWKEEERWVQRGWRFAIGELPCLMRPMPRSPLSFYNRKAHISQAISPHGWFPVAARRLNLHPVPTITYPTPRKIAKRPFYNYIFALVQEKDMKTYEIYSIWAGVITLLQHSFRYSMFIFVHFFSLLFYIFFFFSNFSPHPDVVEKRKCHVTDFNDFLDTGMKFFRI